MEQTHYIIRIKEKGNPHTLTTALTTEYIGNKGKREIIDFYGLEQPDVESYTIRIAGTSCEYGRRKA